MNSQKTSANAAPENGVSSSQLSDANAHGGKRKPSAAELEQALEQSQRTIESLRIELAARNTPTPAAESDISKLATVLATLVQRPAVETANPDNLNRTEDFKNSVATVDGKNMMEQQLSLQAFKNEAKYPISISKALASYIGPSLPITVNGVRVSIPCDGKTYYINESHYVHARERLAKIDLLTSNTAPQIVEVS